MKTNLLLLDSYKNIEDLIQFAFSFSNHFKRNLKIYYVFDFNWMRQSALAGTSGYATSNIVAIEKSLNKEYEEAESNVREQVTHYLKKHSVNFPVDINVSRSNRIDIINSELEKDPDLMVLVSNHQSYSEITGGLVSYPKLVEHVNCPVIVVPDHVKNAELRHVVYASDLNPEDVRTLKHLSGFMKKFPGSHITIFHNEQELDFRKKLEWTGFKDVIQAEIKSEKFDFELLSGKDFLGGMEQFTSESDPDMLVILNEKKGFFKDLFTTSKTKNVLTHFHKPIMVYHEKEEK